MRKSPRAVLNDALRRYQLQGATGVVWTRLVGAVVVLVLVWRTFVFEERGQIIWAIAAYVVAIFPLLLIRADSFDKARIRVIPDILDLLLISVVVANTGGLESPWFPFYLFPLMSASRYLGLIGTFVLAGFATLSYALACLAANDLPWLEYPFILRAFVLSGVALTVAKIARGRRHFQTLVYESPDMIMVLDRRGRIKAFNKECEKIWKVREADVLGKSVRGFYATDEEAITVGRLLSVPPYMIRDHESRIKADGVIIPIRLSAGLFMEEGWILGSIGVFKDQRERKRMEEERLVREKLAAAGRLAQTFSHGIKNDLAAIQTAVGSLKNTSGSNEKIKEACAAIRSSTLAALQKLQNMTMSAKADPVKRDIVSLRDFSTSSSPASPTAPPPHVSILRCGIPITTCSCMPRRSTLCRSWGTCSSIPLTRSRHGGQRADGRTGRSPSIPS